MSIAHFCGLTREQAISLAERLYSSARDDEDGTPDTLAAFRGALTHFLTALAAEGAFPDGRNMADRLVGRLR